jgi:hypothetical protein
LVLRLTSVHLADLSSDSVVIIRYATRPREADPSGTLERENARFVIDTRRFAILEHRWEGVHWDFLVEDGPTLRTWAIDEPIVAGVDLPARPLAAHRPIYLDYEGEISGGRGTVRRLDSGTTEVIEWGEDRVRLVLRGSQLVGPVELWLADEEGRPAWRFRLGKLS